MNRETFSSRFTLLATMVGLAVGLGNVWRFPYMVGRFGGAAFVLLYVLFALAIGIPALIAEWTLGRRTRRGTVGAFERAGLPGGRILGWVFFVTVTAATAYYTNAIGWVAFHGISAGAAGLGLPVDSGAIFPPDDGFRAGSMVLQALFTGLVLLVAVGVLLRGLRSGTERVSRIITPLLFLGLLFIILRSLTLPGSYAGLRWYLLKFQLSDLSPSVAMAALGQAVFSLALGGTFMVVYGSYMNREDRLGRNAVWTAGGDTAAGLLAGLAIFPAVLALGLEPASGPALIFQTLPRVFAEIPAGWLFGIVFFLALAGAAFLSGLAALEVLVAGLTDTTGMSRKGATWMMAGIVYLLAFPPMLNMNVFVRWDLTFGSGAQTAGALVAVLAVGWGMERRAVIGEWSNEPGPQQPGWKEVTLYRWIRWVVPAAIMAVGGWWLATEVLGVVTAG